MTCPYCGVKSLREFSNKDAEFLCGTTCYARGTMKRRAHACVYIAQLHADIEQLLSHTRDELSGMVDTHVRELMGKEA